MIIISDFDGVLFKSLDELVQLNYTIFKNTYKDHKISFKNYQKIFKSYKYLVGPASEYLILNLVIREYGNNKKINFLDEFKKIKKNIRVIKINDYEKIFFKERFIRIKKDFKTWISNFKTTRFSRYLIKNNIKIIILSTKDLYSIKKVVKFFKINTIEIFSSEDFKKFKTKGKIINKIVKTYNKEKEFIFIDDSDHHLKTINNKKVKVYFANWGYQKSSDFKTFSLKKLDENIQAN